MSLGRYATMREGRDEQRMIRRVGRRLCWVGLVLRRAGMVGLWWSLSNDKVERHDP
jgi:hypothetical protein